MSKLGDTIRKTMHTEAAPIGFRAVRPAKTPTMLTLLLLDDADAAKVARALELGASAVILKGAPAGGIEAAVAAAGEAPCGVWPKQADAEEVKSLVAAKADFLVFDAESTPATALLEEKLGYVLALTDEQDDTYLRVLESVALDALFLEDWKGPLTIKKQVELRRVAGLSRKPLILPVEPPLESGEIECLRDAGVSVLLLDGDDKKVQAEMPSLVKLIAELPGPRRRRETMLEVILPRAAEMAAEEEDEEEEDG